MDWSGLTGSAMWLRRAMSEEVMPGQSLVTFSFRNVMETIPSQVERLCRLRKEFRTDFKRKSETEKKEVLRGNRHARRDFCFGYCCCCCWNGEDLISLISRGKEIVTRKSNLQDRGGIWAKASLSLI